MTTAYGPPNTNETLDMMSEDFLTQRFIRDMCIILVLLITINLD